MSSDSGVKVRFVQDIGIVELTGTEKRFNLQYLKKLNEAYESVLRNKDAKAVITTSTGKFFSNGFDLQWLAQQDSATFTTFVQAFSSLLARILTFPMPTIAAINGHAFAGGAAFCLAHDVRVMRTGHGWFSINAVYIKLRLPVYLLDLIRTKVPNGAAWTDVALGRRFAAEEALKAGIVQEICTLAELESTAVKLANEITSRGPFDRDAMNNMKRNMYDDVYRNSSKDWTHFYNGISRL